MSCYIKFFSSGFPYRTIFLCRPPLVDITLILMEPLPKQKYGFDMADDGPYMAHIWVRYGMVRTSYGKYMVPKFVKFQAMGSTWD